MEKIKNTLGISKGDGMMGIGTDQSALLGNSDFKQSVDSGAKFENNIDPKDLNTAGGPNYGRESKVPHHKSDLINKLDPRIGYSAAEREESIASYEAKYGKPREGFQQEHDEAFGRMSGIGSDQSALGEAPPVDDEGHK